MKIRKLKIQDPLPLKREDWKHKRLTLFDVKGWEKVRPETGLSIYKRQNGEIALSVYRPKEISFKVRLAAAACAELMLRLCYFKATNRVRPNVIGKNYKETLPSYRTKSSQRTKVCKLKTLNCRPDFAVMSETIGIRGGTIRNKKTGVFFGWGPKNNQKMKNAMAPIFDWLDELYNEFPETLKKENQLRGLLKENCFFGNHTTITFNLNTQCALHLDAKNLPLSNSIMPVFYFEDASGGELCFPEYQKYFEAKSGDVFIFSGEKVIHGNLPIKSGGIESAQKTYIRRALRFSAVFYTMKGAECFLQDASQNINSQFKKLNERKLL